MILWFLCCRATGRYAFDPEFCIGLATAFPGDGAPPGLARRFCIGILWRIKKRAAFDDEDRDEKDKLQRF